MNDEIVAVITAAISLSLNGQDFKINKISASSIMNEEGSFFVVKPFRKKSLWKNLSKKL